MNPRQAHAVIYTLRSASLPIAATAVVNSTLLIVAHARENRHPALRVYTMRILLMVIIDSVVAVCALWGTGWKPQIDPIVESALQFLVELYESVVIFSFLQFVLACGSGPDRLACRFAKIKRRSKVVETGVTTQSTSGDDAFEHGQSLRSTSDPYMGDSSRDDSFRAEEEAGHINALEWESTGAHDLDHLPEDIFSSNKYRLEQKIGGSSGASGMGSSEAVLHIASVTTDVSSARKTRHLTHIPPLNYVLPPWRSGGQMLRWCVLGALSYVIVGGTLAILGLALLIVPGLTSIKSLIWDRSSYVLSAVQGVAIFSLAELAVNVREEIALLRPYGKFLSVKFVVFFAFWQGLLLHGLKNLGAFAAFNVGCGEICAVTVIQNTLICMEMLAASLIHFYVFPPYDYLMLLAQNRMHHGEVSPASLGCPPTVAEVVDVRDIFRTAWQVQVRPAPPPSDPSGAQSL